MERIRRAADELCLTLSKTLEFLSVLTTISKEKVAFVTSGDIENLRGATEKEEEIVAEFGQLENDREIRTDALSRAIGLRDKTVKLSDLIERMPDHDIRQRLTSLKKNLNDSVLGLTSQNDKLSQLLALQISYTEYMINIIYMPESRSHTYDVQGGRKDVTSHLSIMDFHV